jgi:serine/threonine protein kinase
LSFTSALLWYKCFVQHGQTLVFFYGDVDMLIGKGGTGQVYKAQLSDGTFAAVMILKPSVDAIHEFIMEVEIVTTLQLENVVALRGFSFENFRLVLVYDYMPQGSLDKALPGKCL